MLFVPPFWTSLDIEVHRRGSPEGAVAVKPVVKYLQRIHDSHLGWTVLLVRYWHCRVQGCRRLRPQLARVCRFDAWVDVTNVTSLRNATAMGRSCAGVPSQAVVYQPKAPRLS